MNRKLHLFSALTLSITLIFSSCSIEKRLYRPGYQITHHNTPSQPVPAVANNTAGPEPLGKASMVLKTTHPIPVKSSTGIRQEAGALYASIASTPHQQKFNRASMLETSQVAGQVFITRPVPVKEEVSGNRQLLKKHFPRKTGVKVQASDGGGRSQIVALILCIFLGVFGIHRFYLGYPIWGVIYLLTGGIFGIGWIIDIIRLIIPNGLTPKDQSGY